MDANERTALMPLKVICDCGKKLIRSASGCMCVAAGNCAAANSSHRAKIASISAKMNSDNRILCPVRHSDLEQTDSSHPA
jgi:hypothetical protein